MLALDRVSVGTQLRLARIAVGLTLFDVGSRAGVQPPHLSEFERGRLVLAPDAVARIWAALIDAGAPLAEEPDAPAAA